MFCISSFLKTHIVERMQSGLFESEFASALAENYYNKGLLQEDDMQEISANAQLLTVDETEDLEITDG